jgi:large subunit ribosomal protein L4e
MKLSILSIAGQKVGEHELPAQFSEQLRRDLIQRSVLALQTRRMNRYGAKPTAGKRVVTELSRRRRKYKSSYGKGISRVPRKVLSRSGAHFNWEGAFAPGTRKGRRAHPPKSGKNLIEKINRKENKKAIRSAIAASILKDIVEKRGHKTPGNYPFIVEDKIEAIKKTKEIKTVLEKLKLNEELERCSIVKIRAGRGTMRNRKYVRKKGPLIVVSKKCSLQKACSNITGLDVVNVVSLNTEHLAPGSEPGRLTVWTLGAVKELEEKKLFR